MVADIYILNRQLKSYLESLPTRDDKVIALAMIRKACMFSVSKLANIRSCHSRLEPAYAHLIESALNEKIFTF